MNLLHASALAGSAHLILTNISLASTRAPLPVPEVVLATWEAWDEAVKALDDGQALRFYRPGAYVDL